MKNKKTQHFVCRLMVLALTMLFLLSPYSVTADDGTVTMNFLKSFGEDRDNGMCYKILVQSPDGNRYFVWYYYSLELIEGQNVVITIDRWNDWKTISNLSNGKEQEVRKIVRVN